MSIYTIQSETLTDIADAIRSKTGSSALIPAENMASEITNIPSGGGENAHFTAVLTVERTQARDCIITVCNFVSNMEGILSISVTGLTDCGNNDAYISFELNGTEVSRGTLVTDTSTTITFPDTLVAAGDAIILKFGWVDYHGAEFNGSADITIAGSGDKEFDVLIDWTSYSHISAFDSIPMPANYTDYDHLAMAIIQDGVDKDYMKHMLNAYLQSYVDTGYDNGTLFILDTSSDIPPAPARPAYQISMLLGSSIGKNNTSGTWINDTEILGYSYSWAWQQLWLICFGFND